MRAEITLFKYGWYAPSGNEVTAAIEFALSEAASSFPELSVVRDAMYRRDDTPFVRVYVYRHHHLDPKNELERIVRSAQPSGKLYSIGVLCPDGRAYRVFFGLPATSPTTTIRKDFALTEMGVSVMRAARRRSRGVELGVDSDIRELLACRRFQRRALVIAAAPGWDAPAIPGDYGRHNMALVKNAAPLPAAHNDCTSFLQLLQLLTEDNILRGESFIGIVRTRLGVMGLLDHFLGGDVDLTNLLDSARLSGEIARDAEVGLLSQSDSVSITGGKARLVGNAPAPEDRLMGAPVHVPTRLTAAGDPPSYALLYYSGHGTGQGDIRIEEDQALKPEDLAMLSAKHGVPLVVVLDMCNAAQFGYRYATALRDLGGSGIVMCANDGEAYASRRLADIRRPQLPIPILGRHPEAGFGTFTSAFCLGLLQLREAELAEGHHIEVSVEDFNARIVRPLCEVFSASYGVPLQRPLVLTERSTSATAGQGGTTASMSGGRGRSGREQGHRSVLALPPRELWEGAHNLPKWYLREEEVARTLAANGLFDICLNEQGRGIIHQYEAVERKRDLLVMDRATGLTWQQGASGTMKYEEVETHVAELNAEHFGGYSDWRLPTLKEAMSVMEPERLNGSLFVRSVFQGGEWIWTADRECVLTDTWRKRWTVSYIMGRCWAVDEDESSHEVRVVRSGT